MDGRKLSILVIGAHPDDAEIQAGGVSILYADQGHKVRFVSVTNGDAGHHEMQGETLARRRAGEAGRAGALAGIGYEILGNPDGELEPTIENRRRLIRLIRRSAADLIFTHRPDDYHPDHRYTSVLVQDAVFMTTIPNICPDTPRLTASPVVMYLRDVFQGRTPFKPVVAVGIDAVIAKKMDMLDCHVSQMYEFLPYILGYRDEVPTGEKERRAWLETKWLPYSSADPWRDLLLQLYGGPAGRKIQYAEAFEPGDYGKPLNDGNLRTLFPFFP